MWGGRPASGLPSAMVRAAARFKVNVRSGKVMPNLLPPLHHHHPLLQRLQKSRWNGPWCAGPASTPGSPSSPMTGRLGNFMKESVKTTSCLLSHSQSSIFQCSSLWSVSSEIKLYKKIDIDSKVQCPPLSIHLKREYLLKKNASWGLFGNHWYVSWKDEKVKHWNLIFTLLSGRRRISSESAFLSIKFQKTAALFKNWLQQDAGSNYLQHRADNSITIHHNPSHTLI